MLPFLHTYIKRQNNECFFILNKKGLPQGLQKLFFSVIAFIQKKQEVWQIFTSHWEIRFLVCSTKLLFQSQSKENAENKDKNQPIIEKNKNTTHNCNPLELLTFATQHHHTHKFPRGVSHKTPHCTVNKNSHFAITSME